MTAFGFNGLMPSPVPHETEAAAGGPLDPWLWKQKVAKTERTKRKGAFNAHP
jgi:hypothetical protein